jgi:hypothetical protein
MNRLIKAIAILTTLAAASCGGGGGNASPGGIWFGEDSVSGLQVEGIVDEAGEFRFIRSDGVQYVGNAITSGNAISAEAQELAPLGSTFHDGSTEGTGTITGTIIERSAIQATFTFKTSMGTPTSSSISYAANNATYDMMPSLAELEGNYTDQNTKTPFTIDASGNLSGTDAASGCSFTGTVSIIDATYNAYQVEGTYSGCQGVSAVLNGIAVSGLGTLHKPTCAAGRTFIVGMSGMSGANTYGIVYTLVHSLPFGGGCE